MATANWSRKTGDVPEGVRRQWRADRALRPSMRSPGRPDSSRSVQRQFWRLIATCVSSAEAALSVGVSVPLGARWTRHAGGMPPISLADPTCRYLSFEEREKIVLLSAHGHGVREVARRIGRDPGTVSLELRRNGATRVGKLECWTLVAQWKAQQAAKLVANPELRQYVQDRLAGLIRACERFNPKCIHALADRTRPPPLCRDGLKCITELTGRAGREIRFMDGI